MARSSHVTTLLAALLCVLAAGALALPARDHKQTTAAAAAETSAPDDKELLVLDGGAIYLGGRDCKPDERQVTGMLPGCEPTCENPTPVCAKMFYVGVDSVNCFCREPLVRHKASGKCVKVADC